MSYAGSGLAFADPDGNGLPGQPAYAVPIIADLDGDGEAEVLLTRGDGKPCCLG